MESDVERMQNPASELMQSGKNNILNKIKTLYSECPKSGLVQFSDNSLVSGFWKSVFRTFTVHIQQLNVPRVQMSKSLFNFHHSRDAQNNDLIDWGIQS